MLLLNIEHIIDVMGHNVSYSLQTTAGVWLIKQICLGGSMLIPFIIPKNGPLVAGWETAIKRKKSLKCCVALINVEVVDLSTVALSSPLLCQKRRLNTIPSSCCFMSTYKHAELN